VLSDVSHHFALIIPRIGDYPLEFQVSDFFGLASPQLLVSRDVCRYLTGQVVSLAKRPIKTVNGERAVLSAVPRVTSLKRAVVIAAEVTYMRDGPNVASISGGAPPSCITS
jgi:hypothetical protein